MDRRRPGDPQGSTLSPYLHFGQISPVEIALAVRNTETRTENEPSFLDAAWPERPIFGSVRYMNAAGLERKTDIDGYVARVGRMVT